MADQEKIKLETLEQITAELERQKTVLKAHNEGVLSYRQAQEKILELQQMIVDKQQTESSLAKQILGDIQARQEANEVLKEQSGGFVDLSMELNNSAKKGFEFIRGQIDSNGELNDIYSEQLSSIRSIVGGNSNIEDISAAIAISKAREKQFSQEKLDDELSSQQNITKLLEGERKKLQLLAAQALELEAANTLTGGLFGKGKAFTDLLKENKGLALKTLALGSVVAIFATLISLAKKFSETIDKIGETFGSLRVLGGDVTKTLLASENSAVRLGFGIADVASVTNTLASEFGVSLENASQLSSQVLDTAKATGLSVDEATKLTGQLRIIAGLTADQSENLIESTFQLARQAGVAPQQVLKDIAASSETVAKFTKGTGENLFEAAVAARQLGISVDSIAKAARSTLDFESSVASELEASIMLGQNINLQRARQLAINKDLVGFQEEIKNQLGDIGDFSELNVFQQESLAKAVGMSVEEVARLVSGTEKLTVAGALSAGTFDDLSGQEALSRLSSLTGLFNQISKTLLNELGPVFEDILSNLVAFLGNEQNIQKITNTIRNLASVVGFLAQNLSIVGLLLGAAAGAAFGPVGIAVGAVAGAAGGAALQGIGGGGSALPSMESDFGGGGTTNNRSQADTQAIVNAINNINVSSTLTDRQIRVTLDNIGG
tara:strand:- start:5315 stop:7315 length:2001 start_codon:yes stop_codon:yes gene_type:complete